MRDKSLYQVKMYPEVDCGRKWETNETVPFAANGKCIKKFDHSKTYSWL